MIRSIAQYLKKTLTSQRDLFTTEVRTASLQAKAGRLIDVFLPATGYTRRPILFDLLASYTLDQDGFHLVGFLEDGNQVLDLRPADPSGPKPGGNLVQHADGLVYEDNLRGHYLLSYRLGSSQFSALGKIGYGVPIVQTLPTPQAIFLQLDEQLDTEWALRGTIVRRIIGNDAVGEFQLPVVAINCSEFRGFDTLPPEERCAPGAHQVYRVDPFILKSYHQPHLRPLADGRWVAIEGLLRFNPRSFGTRNILPTSPPVPPNANYFRVPHYAATSVGPLPTQIADEVCQVFAPILVRTHGSLARVGIPPFTFPAPRQTLGEFWAFEDVTFLQGGNFVRLEIREISWPLSWIVGKDAQAASGDLPYGTVTEFIQRESPLNPGFESVTHTSHSIHQVEADRAHIYMYMKLKGWASISSTDSGPLGIYRAPIDNLSSWTKIISEQEYNPYVTITITRFALTQSHLWTIEEVRYANQEFGTNVDELVRYTKSGGERTVIKTIAQSEGRFHSLTPSYQARWA